LLGNKFYYGLTNALPGSVSTSACRIHAIVLTGYTAKKEALNSVFLPVIAGAEGNVLTFSCEYQDNFSAGQKVETISNGSYATEVEYSDYYGRIYYLAWGLSDLPEALGVELDENKIPLVSGDSGLANILSGSIAMRTPYDEYQIIRKDNREKLKIGINVQFLCENEAYVVGSALAKQHTWINGRGDENTAELVVLKRRLGRFDRIIDENDVISVTNMGSINKSATGSYAKLLPVTGTLSQAGKSWAIITKHQTSATPTVYEDEKGNTVEVYEKTGGELLIGKNEDIPSGTGVTVCSGFTVYGCHDLYKLLKNKNI
jgi:hypothetical protein